MTKLTKKQVDEKIYKIIERVNRRTKEGIRFKQNTAIAYCLYIGLPFMTFYGRVRRNQAYGLQYDKYTKEYKVNSEVSKKYYEMSLEPQKTLEGIADKTKEFFNEKHVEQITVTSNRRPLTISDVENSEPYKALKEENETLKAKVKELEAIIEENVDNSYRWNDKVKQFEARNANLTELLESEMEKVKELQKYRKWKNEVGEYLSDYRKKNLFQRVWSLFKSTDGYMLFLVGWLLNGLLTLILSEVLK